MILDPTYLIMVVPAILLSLAAQFYVNSTFRRYSQVRSRLGSTGTQVARRLLDRHGLSEVQIEEIGGTLSDNYDPRAKVLRLSQPVAESSSLASIGVAAHETGHALQDAAGYAPMAIRSAIVPAANLGSSLAIPLIFVGFLLRFSGLIWVGVIFFAGAVLFQIVTLPVEFNASRRAVAALTETGEIDAAETGPVRKVLTAAALTYLAAALVAVLQLLYFIGLGRRD